MPADKTSISLATGRPIQLQELRQYRTYEGLIEGLPTAERNRQKLDHLIAQHQDDTHLGMPYLIPPVEEPIELGRPYRLGTPSALPAVTCIGRFASSQGARIYSSDYYSELIVIWFQPDFAMPIDPAALDLLRQIDWEGHAADLIV